MRISRARTCSPKLTQLSQPFAFAAAAESLSEHPLGKAIVHCYGKPVKPCVNFQMVIGAGVIAEVDGKRVTAGKLKLLGDISVSENVKERAEKYLNEGAAVTYIAIDGELVGFIVLSDTIRSESGKMISSIREAGVQPVLLTGDNRHAAENIAERLNINEVHANCLPEDKLKHIGEYQSNGESVCMIGDGVNDAPALKTANVGIAMGGVGSDIAVDAADIVLVDDEIKELPHLLWLSKKMMKTIKLNLTFSMTLNFVAIALAISGLLGPVVGALVHNAGSVLVIINSAFLLGWKKK